MKNKWLYLVIFFLITINGICIAQNDVEFPKGFVLWAKLNSGVVTSFNSAPDLYAIGVQLNPQQTIVEHLLRVGINAGFVYAAKQTSLLVGPSAAFKLKSFNADPFGGIGDLQAIAEYNWGSNDQRLIGAGLGFEALQKVLISITAQRDYKLNTWWFQTHLAIKLNKKKKSTPSFNQ